ncbi:MAG: rRNA maturation RNase YbeY [Ginsengibacter sp.]
MAGKITFTNHLTTPFKFERMLMKSFLPLIFLEEEVDFTTVSYIFCSDDYLLGLNKQFLDHDTFTDILTFTLSESRQPIISEIYISVDRVKENAETHRVSFQEELYRVMIHGVLHLCGYSDHTKELKEVMTNREDYYLVKVGST